MKVDMSAAAVWRRLRDLNELWRLCVELGKARLTSKTPNSKTKIHTRVVQD